jgi:hypothetical protein
VGVLEYCALSELHPASAGLDVLLRVGLIRNRPSSHASLFESMIAGHSKSGWTQIGEATVTEPDLLNEPSKVCVYLITLLRTWLNVERNCPAPF